VNIPPLVKQAMSQVHDRGNLPFPALVSDLVAAAGVSWEVKDKKIMVPAKGDVVPSRKYLYLPMNKPSLDMAPPLLFPSSSSSPPLRCTHQRIEDLHRKLDRYERRNHRWYTYIKKLLHCVVPSMEEPEIFTSTSNPSDESFDGGDSEDSGPDRPLRIIHSTEDRANF